MITVVKPKKWILNLWGKQLVENTAIYRMMRYVLQVEHEGTILLHNVVTGQMIVLDSEEARTIKKLPCLYNPILESLVTHYFLVPEQYNEYKYVSDMRAALRKIADIKQGSALTFFTILPTTACNARCYYCFEKDFNKTTMSKETAEDVVQFITSRCNGKKVWIKWFGGEPTVAANIISQICSGLKRNGVSYSSIMTTNGYLFDEVMADTAKHLWNLEQVTLSLDGTGQNYNKIKDYIGACSNPYERVLSNIGILLRQGIRVLARMNFDQYNFMEFEHLLSDIRYLYSTNPLLELRAHYINDIQIVNGEPRYHGSKKWYNDKILELHKLSRSAGLLSRKMILPSLTYKWCPAASLRSVTITPQGNLVSCYELLGDNEVKGNVKEGITNMQIVSSWLKYADEAQCSRCTFFPHCGKIYKCPRKNTCYQKSELLFETKKCMIDSYNSICN